MSVMLAPCALCVGTTVHILAQQTQCKCKSEDSDLILDRNDLHACLRSHVEVQISKVARGFGETVLRLDIATLDHVMPLPSGQSGNMHIDHHGSAQATIAGDDDDP